MLKTSLIFVVIGLVCLGFADLQVISLDPVTELSRLLKGAALPHLPTLWENSQALLNTLVFAYCGAALGVLGGTLLAPFFHWPPVRIFCAGLRAIHEIFWAFMLLPLLGLTPVTGVLAIGLPYAAIFAKVFCEIYQEADKRPLDAFPTQTGQLNRFFYGILPLIWSQVSHYIRYRFECALRSSAVLGFIGLPTLGYHLETYFREGHYAKAAALLYAFFLLVASLKYWQKLKLVPLYVLTALLLLPKELQFSLDNARRFLTSDIIPWPLRREGFHDGTGSLHWDGLGLWQWFVDLWQEQVIAGLLDTIVLTQITLVGSGLITLIGIFFYSRHFFGQPTHWLTGLALVVLRTTPEYILAYVLIQIVGPSMIPAILAIALHNGAIISFITATYADQEPARLDRPRRRLDRYFYEVLPKTYGSVLAFLFYRWEVMMRETAILGILGITTLGFFIDSAFADDKLDVAFLLIAVTALLNIIVDSLSQWLRARLKISHSFRVY